MVLAPAPERRFNNLSTMNVVGNGDGRADGFPSISRGCVCAAGDSAVYVEENDELEFAKGYRCPL